MLLVIDPSRIAPPSKYRCLMTDLSARALRRTLEISARGNGGGRGGGVGQRVPVARILKARFP